MAGRSADVDWSGGGRAWVCCAGRGEGDTFSYSNIWLDTGASASAAFPSTIYGGYVDLVRGEVVEAWKDIDMGGMSWFYYASGTPKFFYSVISDAFADNANNSLCTVYKYASSMSSNDNSFQFSGTQLRIRDDAYSDADVFKSALSGQTFVYPLATPIYHTIDPAMLRTFRGVNNVWSNAGNIELSYWGH